MVINSWRRMSDKPYDPSHDITLSRVVRGESPLYIRIIIGEYRLAFFFV